MTDRRRQPKSPENRAKISAALKRYAARPESHLHALHQTGPDHPRFTTGINANYYRRIAFEAYGEACQRCGSTRNVDVHHKDENRHNSDLSNLEVLCRSCHSKAHGKGAHLVQRG
jgi:5-methylcytosine-specific restriction endonuclease McrA